MVSKMAKDTIAKWEAEGLRPTFDDAILINDLGLRIERASDATALARVPRCSFLGDAILWEPSVYKMMWLDKARQVVAEDEETQTALVAFTLNTNEQDLPQLKEAKDLVKRVQEFRDHVLIFYSPSQILTAIDIALNDAAAPTTEPLATEHKEAAEVPREWLSLARQTMALALANGLYGVDLKEVTVPALEAMVARALMSQGKDVVKELKSQAFGDYLVAVGRIHERLVEAQKQKENRKEQK